MKILKKFEWKRLGGPAQPNPTQPMRLEPWPSPTWMLGLDQPNLGVYAGRVKLAHGTKKQVAGWLV